MQQKQTSNARGWYVAVLSALTSSLSAATAAQFSATLVPLATKLGTSQEIIALTESAKSVIVVPAMLLSPALTRKFGWRPVFIAGFLSFLIPQIGMPLTSSLFVLTALKALQGFSALLFPLFLSLIMEWSTPRSMGLATSIFTGCFYAGGVFGGTVAGYVIESWTWEATFHVLSAAMIVMATLFFLTVTSRQGPEKGNSSAENRGAYRFVVRHRLTWFLIAAFLPTVWTIQAIWADMVPFGAALGYADAQTGNVMGLSATAILAASLLSGKASDLAAASARNRLKARTAVFSLSAVMVIAAVAALVLLNPAPPRLFRFNLAVFLLSFGAAWGLGSFYCIFPDFYTDDQVAAANGFIGGIADLAMPLSPIVMALVGIRMNLWSLAWSSCAVVAVAGLFFAAGIYRFDAQKRMQ